MSPSHDLIERLYGEHHHAVLRFARSRDYDLAEDVVSETFAIAMRRADAIPAGAERAWLCGVADNVLRNLRRKEARAASLPGVLQLHTPGSSAPHEPPAVGPALGELPPTERDVLTLTAFEGLSSAEAAERLGLSPGSTRNAMVRARRNLAIQLGAFGVLMLVPILFFLTRDRVGEQAPQAQRLAQTLSRALSVETDATVSTGAQRGRYGVSIDRSIGRQRITLPGGEVAAGPLDGPLRVVPKSGTTLEERRQVRRDNAEALAALQTITSGDLERFLGQARRAEVQQRTTGSGKEQVTVIRGPFTTRDGRDVELRVTLGGSPATLRQLQVRPAGKPRAPWTTVDVRSWRVELPGASSTVPAVAAPPGSVPSASGPAETSPPGGIWKPAGQTTKESSAPRRRSGPEPVSKREAARNRAEVAAVPAYAGTTGAVLHTKSVSVSFKVSDDPRETRSYTVAAEEWHETGGGQRFRRIESYFDEDRGRPAGGAEHWGSPDIWALIPTDEGQDTPSTASSVALWCTPDDTPAAAPDEEALALEAARADVDSLPAGPEIRGSATRVLIRVLPNPRPKPDLSPAEIRTYLDAETTLPLRRTFKRPGTDRVSNRIDYSLWEEVSAGGPADHLAGTLPERFRLQKPGRCPATAPLPAAATPEPGAPVPAG